MGNIVKCGVAKTSTLCTVLESRFTLELNAAKNTKKLQIKIVQNLISYKKLSGCICLSLPGVEVGAPKIAIFEIL